MDQQSPDILPSVELPEPKQEAPSHEYAAQPDTTTEQVTAKQIEQGVSVPADPVQTTQLPVSQPVSGGLPIVAPHDAPPNGVPGMAVAPAIADDSDLIEKEWVDKAKQIVEHTKHDPHKQSKEMNVMKADYLKKRYNKDVKLSE